MTDNRTTELREKLTECGIEYTAKDHLGAYETSWDGFTAMQLTPGAKLMMVFTPEQAISATLGNSRAERTCEPKWTLQCKTQTQEFWRCECGNCGYEFGVEDRRTFPFEITIDEVDVPNFCPECGAKQKVVGE